ncbi:hypothetical protein [Aeromonas sp. Y318-1]|uniref:hypothetical protein n=1 Tax=Aeromonas TaxID=642 RepID=UPI0022E145FE|nr:hypothetical protein [Aeromonas sp. Y318-1]
MRGVVLIGALFLLCTNAVAVPQERILDVSVNIVANQASAQLEIISPRTDFLVVYVSSLRTFQPLDIPFTVSTVDGDPHNYDLTLAQLSGQCALSGGVVTPLTPSARLDGQPFSALSPGSGSAAPEQAHVLTLTFPNISQAAASQACDGVVAVVAAVTL